MNSALDDKFPPNPTAGGNHRPYSSFAVARASRLTIVKVCNCAHTCTLGGTSSNEKSARRDANTALAVGTRSQKYSPRRRPLPGGAGPPKFNQLETVTTYTYGPILVTIDPRNFELSW